MSGLCIPELRGEILIHIPELHVVFTKPEQFVEGKTYLKDLGGWHDINNLPSVDLHLRSDLSYSIVLSGLSNSACIISSASLF